MTYLDRRETRKEQSGRTKKRTKRKQGLVCISCPRAFWGLRVLEKGGG